MMSLAFLFGSGGCGGDGDDDIEGAAWTAAGVDDPDMELSVSNGLTTLTASIDTSLPIGPEQAEGFVNRSTQIIWRTHPQRFDVLVVTVAHDGEEVLRADPVAADTLEARFGPRPAGLDKGDSRSAPDIVEPFGDDWKALRGESGPTAISTFFELLMAKTAGEHFGLDDATFKRSERQECFTGLNGDQPTGRFRFASSLAGPASDEPLSLLPALADYWTGLGLEVNTANFDGGHDSIQVTFDGVGTLSATASRGRVMLEARTACLEP